MARNKRIKKRHPEAVYFTDISIVKNDHILCAAQYYALENKDDEKTALISLKNNKWGGTNLQGIAHALRIDHIKGGKRVIYVLDRNRAVYKLNPTIQGDWIKINKDRRGFLMDLQKIGDKWYSVGGHYQVYKEVDDVWTEMDEGIYVDGNEGEAKLLTTIDGTSEEDIYAAGTDGVIFHFDGNAWELLDTPTNLGIQKILCLSDGYVYACGHSNLLMKGNRDGWTLLTEPDDSITYWDMIEFKGEVYVCSKKRLFRLSPQEIPLEVDIQVDGPLGFYRMSCNSRQLWTVGNECVLKYDGRRWEQFKFPLNEV